MRRKRKRKPVSLCVSNSVRLFISFVCISFYYLPQYGRKIGKLLKGAEPDINAAAKLVLHDWQRAPRYARDTLEIARRGRAPRSRRGSAPRRHPSRISAHVSTCRPVCAGGRLPYFTLPPDFKPDQPGARARGESGARSPPPHPAPPPAGVLDSARMLGVAGMVSSHDELLTSYVVVPNRLAQCVRCGGDGELS